MPTRLDQGRTSPLADGCPGLLDPIADLAKHTDRRDDFG